jgi:peptide-methionine (S)-S-oxide reductase
LLIAVIMSFSGATGYCARKDALCGVKNMKETRMETGLKKDAVPGTTQKATFAAGCFWGVEETFRKINGVVSTRVGYTGGTMKNPTYEGVCTDKTGHAESVEVTYDPSLVSYGQLLDVFWANHNPTTLNRQGFDTGTQYRSVIFYHTEEQKKEALASKEKLQASGKYRKPVVTQIVPAQTFYPAEEYHQKYLYKRGSATCHP